MIRKLNIFGYSILCMLFLLLVGFFVASAEENQPFTGYRVFIPGVFNDSSQAHSITGQVLNQQNVPMPGVTIRTDKGQAVITDINGAYSLVGLGEGNYTLTPSLSGVTFSPATSSVVVPPDAGRLNFTAQLACAEAIVNGSFESNTGWDIPDTAYDAGYSTAQAHSGSRSLRTGITTLADNTYSYSSASQRVSIPSGTNNAYLTFWIKPYSGNVGSLASLPASGSAMTELQSETQSAGDVQYVLILDSNFNIIRTLLWQLSDSRTWTQYQFDLASYAGRTIYIHFGTKNDGFSGVSSMFVDDVSLQICPSGSPTPTPTTGPCVNLLDNPSFETRSDWEIPNTAYPAGYSTTQKHTGTWSMRTGILSSGDNTYSYSDFRQSVAIPAGTTSATARFWLYPLSGEARTLAEPQVITPTGQLFSNTVLSGDLQYVLVLDRDQNWIDTLVWQRSNLGSWRYYEFDLRRYAGRTIYLQFGTYNDGWNGITSMFVDDVSLDNCTTTPTVTPSPSPTPTRTPTPAPCQELIVNNDFSASTGWQIPLTNYPAGYSNAQYHSPFRSMRTGIVNPADNTYSYSDFRQLVTVPSTANHVTLSMWVLPFSSETGVLAEPTMIAPTGKPFSETTLSSDTQYLLVLDENQNWIDTLIWQRSNSQTWTNIQFDLSAYKGDKIYLQWGTFNNGSSGVTSMYVDDVTLQACP